MYMPATACGWIRSSAWRSGSPMNRILRLLLLHLQLRGVHRPLWTVHGLRMQVTLRDLDLLRHVNNGSYLQLMDVGRIAMMMESGAWASMARRGWISVVTSETITFRRSLHWGQRYTLQTRIVGWDDTCFIVEQRFVRGDEVYVRGFVRQLFVRRAGGAVHPDEVIAEFGAPERLPRVPAWVRAWAGASELPRNAVHYPSVWDPGRPWPAADERFVTPTA